MIMVKLIFDIMEHVKMINVWKLESGFIMAQVDGIGVKVISRVYMAPANGADYF